MLVSDLAMNGAGLPSTSKRGASVKKRVFGDHGKDPSARSITLSKSCGALHIQILSMREKVQSC